MFWQRTVQVFLKYAESIIDALRIHIIALNQNLNVISVSPSFMSTAFLQPKQRLSGSSGRERRL
jgi:hypothetical protein